MYHLLTVNVRTRTKTNIPHINSMKEIGRGDVPFFKYSFKAPGVFSFRH